MEKPAEPLKPRTPAKGPEVQKPTPTPKPGPEIEAGTPKEAEESVVKLTAASKDEGNRALDELLVQEPQKPKAQKPTNTNPNYDRETLLGSRGAKAQRDETQKMLNEIDRAGDTPIQKPGEKAAKQKEALDHLVQIADRDRYRINKEYRDGNEKERAKAEHEKKVEEAKARDEN